MTGRPLLDSPGLPGEAAIRRGITALMTVWAACTVFVHGAIGAGLSFTTVALLLSAVVAVVLVREGRGIAHGFPALHHELRHSRESLWALGLLGLLVVLCALLSLTVNNWWGDAWGYLARARLALEHPAQPLTLVEPWVGTEDAPFRNAYNLPYCIEFFWAYLAALARVHLLDIVCFVVPPLMAALVPLSWYLALAHFTRRPLAAVVGVALICAFLNITGGGGEPGGDHYGIGDMAFVRIWDSKVDLIVIFLPLTLAHLLAFVQVPSRRRFYDLAVLMTAAAGFGLNAPFMLPPFLALLIAALALSHVLARARPPVRILALAAAASTYLIFEGVWYFLISDPNFRGWYSAEAQRRTFATQFAMVFGKPYYPGFVLFAVCSLVTVFRRKGWSRSFLCAWLGLTLVFTFNPVVYAAVKAHAPGGYITSYWRFFYLMPFPLVIALAPLSVLERRLTTGLRAAGGVGGIVALVVTVNALNIFPFNVYGKHPLYFGEYKMPPHIRQDMLRLLRTCPPGLVLAPRNYARAWPIFDVDYPQVVHYRTTLYHYANRTGSFERINRLVRAQDCIEEGDPRYFPDLVATLDTEYPRTAIFDEKGAQKLERAGVDLNALMGERDFVLIDRTARFRTYTRHHWRVPP